MKMDWNVTGAIVFGIVFVSLSALVYAGKVQPTMLGALLAWLVPSPIGPKGGAS